MDGVKVDLRAELSEEEKNRIADHYKQYNTYPEYLYLNLSMDGGNTWDNIKLDMKDVLRLVNEDLK